MADEFSFTDSDDERAVEDVLSQARDHSLLEQIAAINCSSFTSDNLPPHLENRFRKLKSLPTTSAAAGSRFPPSKSKSLGPRSGENSNVEEPNHRVDSKQIPDAKKCTESSPSIDTPEEHFDENLDEKKCTKSNPKVCKTERSKSKTRSDSWSLSSESESDTRSPPRRSIGCLWCSPKKEKSVSRKQGKENRLFSSSSSLGNDIEFLKTFSTKEQKKIMIKAMKEEEKINREAEKIVKWAKQASARMMDVSGLDDELSDFENNSK